MSTFFSRLGIIVVIVTLEASLFQILFPVSWSASLVLLATIVWTLTLGFSRSIWIALPMLFLYEVLFYGTPGPFMFLGVLLSLGTNYLSAWVHYDQTGLSFAWYALLGALAMEVWHLWINGWPGSIWWSVGTEMAILFGVSLVLFPLLSKGISRVEEFLDAREHTALYRVR